MAVRKTIHEAVWRETTKMTPAFTSYPTIGNTLSTMSDRWNATCFIRLAFSPIPKSCISVIHLTIPGSKNFDRVYVLPIWDLSIGMSPGAEGPFSATLPRALSFTMLYAFSIHSLFCIQTTCRHLNSSQQSWNLKRCITAFTSSLRDGGGGGTRWFSWLRHYATSRKVAGLIPDGANGNFQLT